MSGFASGGASESEAKSRTGLRGTPWENQAAGNAYGAAENYGNIFKQFQTDPFHFAGQSGADMLPGGKYGLGSNADAAVNEFGSMMHGLSSADYGSRGFLSPENRGAVIGSAITRALPQLVPNIQSWQLSQFQAPLSLWDRAMQGAASVGDLWSRLLGGQSDASSSSWNFAAGGGTPQAKAGQ